MLEHLRQSKQFKKGGDYEPQSLKVMMASLDRNLKNKAAPCPLHVKRCCRTKRNSFAWLAVVSAQTKLGKYQRRKKKFSGRAENSR